MFAFSPERCSASFGNTVRLRRNPQISRNSSYPEESCNFVDGEHGWLLLFCDMFTIPAEDRFAFTEEGIVLHKEELAGAPEDLLEGDSSPSEEPPDEPEQADGGTE